MWSPAATLPQNAIVVGGGPYVASLPVFVYFAPAESKMLNSWSAPFLIVTK